MQRSARLLSAVCWCTHLDSPCAVCKVVCGYPIWQNCFDNESVDFLLSFLWDHFAKAIAQDSNLVLCRAKT